MKIWSPFPWYLLNMDEWNIIWTSNKLGSNANLYVIRPTSSRTSNRSIYQGLCLPFFLNHITPFIRDRFNKTCSPTLMIFPWPYGHFFSYSRLPTTRIYESHHFLSFHHQISSPSPYITNLKPSYGRSTCLPIECLAWAMLVLK